MSRRLHTALLLALAAAPAVGQLGFTEEFDGQTLDGRWEWYTPRPGPTVSLTDTPGALRVTMPQLPRGFNHWTGQDADAPLLLTKAPAGDFSPQAHLSIVSFGPDSNFHAALAVTFSRRCLVGWGPFHAPLLCLLYTSPSPRDS